MRTTPGPRIAAALLLGVLLAQAAWIVAVPPFRGMDEFDHAFRAAGVASGQWRLDTPAEGGRGLLVEVPEELVQASEGQCADLPYIETSTCDGDGPGERPGTVVATTSAANYLPAYYWVVGTAGEPFSGSESLLAMRVASAALCALVLALAGWCLTQWIRGPWALVGLLAGLSPTLLYTTTVVAPNGLEMAAGVLVWAALLGVARTRAPSADQLRTERRLLVAAAVGVVLLCGLRALGPLWVALIIVCVAALRGPGAVLATAGRHRLVVAVTVVLAALTTLAVVAWNRGNVDVPKGALNDDVSDKLVEAFRYPTWVLGSIGAFPYRNQPAPLVVHVLVLLVLGTLLVVAVRRGRGQGRWAVVIASVLCLAVPTVLVAATLAERGGIWQGRYSLPFTAGVVLLAGLVADRARWRQVPGDVRPQLLATAMLAVAHIVSVVHVQRAELDRAVSSSDPGWHDPPVVVTGLVMAAGWVVLAICVARTSRRLVPREEPAPALAGESGG